MLSGKFLGRNTAITAALTSALTLTLMLTLSLGLRSGTAGATESARFRDFNVNTNAFPYTPDENRTTGSLCDSSDPDFQEYRYSEQIPYCKRSVSSSAKDAIYRDYGVAKKCRRDYTIDHFIPLSIGGTNSRNNLWPEPKSVKALRKDLELELFHAVSNGRMSQKEAIERIREAKFNPPIQNPRDIAVCL